MNIVLVEDDFVYSDVLIDALARSFRHAEIECVKTEHDFLMGLTRWQAKPPTLFIIDLFLPWAFTGDVQKIPRPEGYSDESFRMAGVRCAKTALALPNISNVPMIIHTVGRTKTVAKELDGTPPNLEIVSKSESTDTLVLKIRSLIQAATSGSLGKTGKDIFVVHGHDDEAKETVARFIEKLGGRAVVLHEQPNAGQSIIEKFEQNASVSFAIVLLTPDDLGGKSAKTLKKRARQNVIFELGFFIARLGRSKVCALHKEDVELPSDIQGVIYTPLDKAGAWRMILLRELKAAGIPLDYDKAI